MYKNSTCLIALIAALVGLNIAKLDSVGEALPSATSEIDQKATSESEPFFQQQFVSVDAHAPRVHAATAIVNDKGELRTYWYAGAREGAEDVAIFGARYDQRTGAWIDQQKIIDTQTATDGSGHWARKLGNPVAYAHPNGDVWMFYVNVSFFGWAWSTLNIAVSTDGGRTFGDHQRLVTSPFFNRSTLVRSSAVSLEDGYVALPAYHELISKHGELFVFDESADLVDKRRIPAEVPALQPSVVDVDNGDWVAFLRNAAETGDNRNVLRSVSKDNGKTWSEAEDSNIPNPDSAVAVIDTPNGLIMACNNDSDNRDGMSLMHSVDQGLTWQEIYVLDYQANVNQWDHSNEFSYPSFVQDDEGRYHLFYTWQRSKIKHIAFNDEWLAQTVLESEAVAATGKTGVH